MLLMNLPNERHCGKAYQTQSCLVRYMVVLVRIRSRLEVMLVLRNGFQDMPSVIVFVLFVRNSFSSLFIPCNLLPLLVPAADFRRKTRKERWIELFAFVEV